MSILNLQKNDVLDLTKKDPSLNNIILGCGWDINTEDKKKGLFGFLKNNYDLDLIALLLDENDKMIDGKARIDFSRKKGQGILLHGDNLTGKGEGDDEQISVTLNELPNECSKVLFAVTIFGAKFKKQDFSKVKNAYIRILNSDKYDEEICIYNFTEDGKDSHTLIFGHIERKDITWEFKAIGELLTIDSTPIEEMYK